MNPKPNQRALKRSRQSTSASENGRTSQACDSCRQRKIKCSGSQPCDYCLKRRRPCSFPEPAKKKLYSIDYIKSLEQRASSSSHVPARAPTGPAASEDDTHDSSEMPVPETLGTPDALPPTTPSRTNRDPSEQYNSSTVPEMPTLSHADPVIIISNLQHEDRLSDSDVPGPTTILPDSVSSSSLHFTHQVKLLHPRSSANNQLQTFSPDDTKIPSNDTYDMANSIQPPSVLQWPSYDEAQSLLNTVLGSIGKLQHLFEPRQLSDKISIVYQNGSLEIDHNDLWYAKLLMVFAIGKLLQGQVDSMSSLPGKGYYCEAKKRIPDLVTLRDLGVPAVEVMGMMTFYAQCADKRDDAYLYAGVAVRLAISHGMSREKLSSTVLPSEKAHQARLWWTIYMQERRLAAATGYPLSIDDDSISAALPADSPGFTPASALVFNIKLAKTTGQAMKVIYKHGQVSTSQYVRQVKVILSDLVQVARSLPTEHARDIAKPLDLSRASATLYLMLYQCICLITRPTLLHLAKLRLNTDSDDSNTANNRHLFNLEKLANTCMEAAARSLDILKALTRNGLIATFGFFDLEATFSAAFVFVLFESIYRQTSKGCGAAGIRTAFEILHHLAAKGNKVAVKRRADIEQMCAHLDLTFQDTPETQMATATELAPSAQAHADSDQAQAPRSRNHFDVIGETSVIPTNTSPSIDWTQVSAAFFDQQVHDDALAGSMAGVPFAEGLCDLAHLPADFPLDDFVLTGIDQADWEELSRQFSS